MVSIGFFLISVLVFQIVTISPLAHAQTPEEDIQIPSWFKNNAEWWAQGKISDVEILNAIENLLNRGIIQLDSKNAIKTSESTLSSQDERKIPTYVKDVFVFWHQGSVSDAEVANSIKFLIESDIIIASESSAPKEPRKSAAIIDQLSKLIPNPYFQEKSKEYLETAGYKVDVFNTEDVTVDFFKNLPTMNYKYIIFRTHSLEEPESENPTFLFTGEKYDVNKYIQEQLFLQVSKGAPIYEEDLILAQQNPELFEDKMYFIVGSKFVDELMLGEFPDTTIIIGGCESVRTIDLAESLINRGAASVVGWDRSIQSSENDQIILKLLEEILIEKSTINDSIVSVMKKYGSNLHYSSLLQHIYR